MKIQDILLTITAALLLGGNTSCDSKTDRGWVDITGETAVFRSTDKELEKAYEWARTTALSYSYSGLDPVGDWYMAGLPIREAFCMRDVSHQSTGAQILGLTGHNKNMFSNIVRNIGEERDWCSYWEINRYGKPVPASYSNDKEFWYNLPANPDVIQACLNMYDWTGDDDYINAPEFTNFFDHTVNDYVVNWNLTPDCIMDRGRQMPPHAPGDNSNTFRACRGIPSYNENLPGLALGIDLIAGLQGGYEAYSSIARLRGDIEQSHKAHATATQYRRILDEKWWDESQLRYFSGLMPDGSFVNSEGSLYILWFGATDNEERIGRTLSHIHANSWDIQYSSYFPEVFYRYGCCREGYDYLMHLPSLSMADYPEIAFSFISGCVCGAMGFTPSYSDKSVTTLCRLGNPREESQISNIAVFDGHMSVRHEGHTATEIANDTSVDLTWKASFMGEHPGVSAGGKHYTATHHRDAGGNTITTALITLPAHSTLKAKVHP